MKKVQHDLSRATFELIACLAALAAAHALSAQTAPGGISLTQPPLNNATVLAAIATGEGQEPRMEAFAAATVYNSVSTEPSHAMPSRPDPAPPTPAPRIEIMGAYARWHPYSSVNGEPLFPLKDGGVVSGTYYWDRNLGVEVEGSYYEQTANDGRRGGAAGPTYRFVLPHVLIRAHGLIGSEKFLGPVVANNETSTFYANPPVWATVLTAGISADLAVPKTHGYFALRAQADYQYIHASYGPAGTFNGGQVNINGYRIVPGLVFRLRHTADSPRRSRKSDSY